MADTNQHPRALARKMALELYNVKYPLSNPVVSSFEIDHVIIQDDKKLFPIEIYEFCAAEFDTLRN